MNGERERYTKIEKEGNNGVLAEDQRVFRGKTHWRQKHREERRY